jgi:hypothetical protein
LSSDRERYERAVQYDRKMERQGCIRMGWYFVFWACTLAVMLSAYGAWVYERERTEYLYLVPIAVALSIIGWRLMSIDYGVRR